MWNPPGDLWSIGLSGSDPSGVCQMWATLNGVQIDSPGQTPDTAVWQQCPDWTWSASVDTRNYVPTSGPLSLTLAGSNAAGVVSAPAETLEVDNDPVQLSLSGPTTASTSSGTQYVTATASAGAERRRDRLLARWRSAAMAKRNRRAGPGRRSG